MSLKWKRLLISVMAYSKMIIIDYDNTSDNEDEDKASRLDGKCNALIIIDRMTSEVKDVISARFSSVNNMHN